MATDTRFRFGIGGVSTREERVALARKAECEIV